MRAIQNGGDGIHEAATPVTISFNSGSANPVDDTLLATTTFSYIGANLQPYTVPPDAHYVVIAASAGGGGASAPFSFGGRGASLSTAYMAFPGELFSVAVGGGGSANNQQGREQSYWWPSIVSGGWPNGDAGHQGGGGGGGSSYVVTG